MVMSWIFTGMIAISIFCAAITGRSAQMAAAIPQGAQTGITVAFSLAGSVCLWSGIGNLMHAVGVTRALAKFFRPLLQLLFPSTKTDPQLAQDISGNICANILGLGNAATPMGIRATKQMAQGAPKGAASDEMCRFIVLNSASIQLIPATVAAIRLSLGSTTPFDILPAVWLTSFCSAGTGLLAAGILGKLWKHG